MHDHDPRFQPFEDRLQAAEMPELFIDTFAYYYHHLLSGESGLIGEEEITPVESITHMMELPGRLAAAGADALSQTAMIKLNGGLGTSMGLQEPKSLLVVKEGQTFLDIAAAQAAKASVPLILMNSFATDEETRAALQECDDGLSSRRPWTFLQHMEPKVRQTDYAPAEYPGEPELAWCPPGHGDIYLALLTRGVLDRLLSQDYGYAFISNADNLGATLDLSLLGYFADHRLPFMMEVANRTESDRKGGHLAQRKADGRLILRESAQCPPEAADAFQDIARYRYFNTNNLWINLQALDQALRSRDHNLRLPMIRNRKTVDPRDPDSTPVYQLETAMGSAISVFEGAEAIVVPRSRFAPVKKTDDLLVVRSDAYELADDCSVQLRSERKGMPPVVALDPQHYQFVEDFDRRFASGIPSLLCCDSFTIEGNYFFGRDVTILGDVVLRNESDEPAFVTDGTTLRGEQ